MESLSIVIPCYNEEGNVERLLKLINSILSKKEFVKFILVDNGSTDNTLQNIKTHKLFLNSNIELIEIQKNIGYGNGIIKGISNANRKHRFNT